MKTVNIGELKNQLSGFLQHVRNGEEVVVRDREVPIARIIPFRPDHEWEREAQLVAAGVLKLPEKEMDWDEFFAGPAGSVSQEDAIRAVVEGRGDR